MSYNSNLEDAVSRGAYCIVRIKNGRPAAGLAVEQATRPHLNLDLKKVRELGLSLTQQSRLHTNE